MDSCNSGSMQSSSGCDEEYDSSKPSDHSFSNFFNSSTTTSNIIPTIQPSLTSSSPSSFFDPLPNYLDTFSRSPPMDDTSWLRPPLPDSNLIPSSLSVPPIFNTTTLAPSSSVQRPGISPTSRPRNSKKRSRASRRAPTTVLTTDTANFRAMVQEFTGIPTASFMPYSSLPPPRFDLLHSLPPYLLRPFAQKVHHHHHHHPSPSPPLDHVNIANSIATIHFTSNAHTSSATTTTPTSLGSLNVMQQQQQQQQQQNPILTFQSLQDQTRPPANINIPTQLTSKAPLEFDWHKGGATTTGQSHEGSEDQRGGSAAAGMDSWVLSSD